MVNPPFNIHSNIRGPARSTKVGLSEVGGHPNNFHERMFSFTMIVHRLLSFIRLKDRGAEPPIR
jgi:hypothetical protein